MHAHLHVLSECALYKLIVLIMAPAHSLRFLSLEALSMQTHMVLMDSDRFVSNARNCLPFLVKPRISVPDDMKSLSLTPPGGPASSTRVTGGPGMDLNACCNMDKSILLEYAIIYPGFFKGWVEQDITHHMLPALTAHIDNVDWPKEWRRQREWFKWVLTIDNYHNDRYTSYMENQECF